MLFIIYFTSWFIWWFSGPNSLLSFNPLETSVYVHHSSRSLIIVMQRYLFHSLLFICRSLLFKCYLITFYFLCCMICYTVWHIVRQDIWCFMHYDQVRLIASVPGYHSGTGLKKWGHMKLRSLLQECTFDEEFKKSPLIYQVLSGCRTSYNIFSRGMLVYDNLNLWFQL